VNINSTVGAVGFVPRYAGFLYPVRLVRVDETTGEPIRGKNGLCIQCKPGGL
jgi:solute carrier family 27 fatty acid transporter 1/4